MRFSKIKGQSIAEYSILIALIIAAAIGVQTYVKRGLQARMKAESDMIVTNLADAYETHAGELDLADATEETQWEDTLFSKKQTSDIQADTVNTVLKADGTQTEEFVRTIGEAAFDHQTHNYTDETAVPTP